MKTEVNIFNLNGNRAAIRDYAETIAKMNPAISNAYVMAFDKCNEILFVVQAGDDPDDVKAAINWQSVRRVEIYDHSADRTYKTEQVYITSRKSLNEYTSERNAADFVVTENRTAYTVGAWQTAEDDAQSDDTNEGDDNEGDQTPAEPSRLAQMAEKAAEKVKIYAHRIAFVVSLAAVAVLCVSFSFGCVSALLSFFHAVGVESAARQALTLCAVLPIIDITLWLELNVLAAVSRLFPGMFPGSGPAFCAPRSFLLIAFRSRLA